MNWIYVILLLLGVSCLGNAIGLYYLARSLRSHLEAKAQ